MHWKGLRIGASNSNDSKRRTFIEPQPRHSEQLSRPNHSSTELASRRSESAPRPRHLTEPDEAKQAAAPGESTANDSARMENPGASSNGGIPSWRRNRFSFMRLRHASDPQLSRSYAKGEEDVPPVPSLPPPTIITTAPTNHEIEQPIKRNNKLQVLPKSKNSSREELSATTGSQNAKRGHDAQDSVDSHHADPAAVGEEPGRLSTNSLRSGHDHPGDSHRSSVTDPRFSESSRSDQSQKSQSSRRIPGDGMIGTKRFRMPRLKKNRGPLFPLPPKPTADGDSRPPNSVASKSDLSDDQDHVSALQSPARSSAGLSYQPPPLARESSATSAHSTHSSSSNQGRDAPGRNRASTMDSLDNQPSPVLASSSRTSTSTSGRKSFGDIFNFSQRFRQNSEPPLPRNGSPGVGGSATPMSKLSSHGPPSYPARDEDDTPAKYLSRLGESVPKGAIAGILARSDEEFYKTALRKYMRGFAFFGDPIDMAIRKLLMEVGLPKETQQIDRFLQAFADRYHECNPGIFASEDQAYFIAFSILILHTDVFNKNNKRKMQKPDYVKNTRGEGIAEDILECFYENISYTPFIHIEDASVGARHLARPKRTLFKSVSSDNLRTSREPVDPYALILEGKLDSLRPSLKDVMDLDDTYSCTPLSGPPDMDRLHQTFAKSGILQIVSARSRPDAFMPASIDNPADSHPGLVDIKVAKVGLLWRKDPRKKRARSPWQEWGALLTFSQLYFFRDANWVKSLMSQHEPQQPDGRRRTVIFKPPLTDFKPDGIMSTDDAVALLDSGYTKHKHAFVFVRHNSLEEVFLANSESDMDDWLAKLNYAAAFRTTGVRTKGMIAPNYEGQRYRISHVSNNSHQSMEKEPPSPNIETDVAEELVSARRDLMSQRVRELNEKLFAHQKQLDDLLRNARHLQTLTPVHSRAREQVIMAAGRMAAKVKWVRQDIWRTKCYRDVLDRDIGEEHHRISNLGHLHPVANTAASEPGQASPVRTDEDKDSNPPSGASQQVSPDKSETVDKESTSLPPSARRASVPVSVTSSEVGRSARPHSVDNGMERAKSTSPAPVTGGLEREPSLFSASSKMDTSSLGSGSKFAPASIDDGEERILRETGLLEVNSSPRGRKQNQEIDAEPKSEQTSSPSEHTSRIRRSLHRTLRESRHGHHDHRGKKARDSMSSNGAEDEAKNEGEGLSRKTPSFTVHGKKASIVTFGTEWETMTPEERLKLRKPTPSEERRADSDQATLTSGTSEGHPQSLRSASTATRRSYRQDEPVLGIFEEIEPCTGDDAADPGSPSDMEATSPTTPRAPTYNGRLAVPNEEGMPSSAGSSDEAVDTERIQRHSPPEQTVSA